ncbi:hypothetical protein L596_019762 [Steinernema carpocapsae]|uniref:Uncharacterized protein n=1 Tax=Steinernema carpocapsae TaxID=34508 RepID=A0A4U5MRK9_STECR|nr:hypothetical protein L596_019762 [Steinernema carpocapsae]
MIFRIGDTVFPNVQGSIVLVHYCVILQLRDEQLSIANRYNYLHWIYLKFDGVAPSLDTSMTHSSNCVSRQVKIEQKFNMEIEGFRNQRN